MRGEGAVDAGVDGSGTGRSLAAFDAADGAGTRPNALGICATGAFDADAFDGGGTGTGGCRLLALKRRSVCPEKATVAL